MLVVNHGFISEMRDPFGYKMDHISMELETPKAMF